MFKQMLPLCVTFDIVHNEKTVEFFTKILSMSILERCETAYDGPYDGKWSKTMVKPLKVISLSKNKFQNFILQTGYDNDNFKLVLICGSKNTFKSINSP
jgi:hypothetical protein